MKKHVPRYPEVSAHAEDSPEATSLYDHAGSLNRMTDADGAVLICDAAGNVIAMTDADGVTISFAYDALNRLVTATDAAGNTTTYEYDARGNRVRVTDANGNVTRTEYDEHGRLGRVIDALGRATSLTYAGSSFASGRGDEDRPVSLTDANGNTTIFVYDSKGRLKAETDPLGNTIHYGYDDDGNVIRRTDAGGDTIDFVYDGAGRLIEKHYPDGTAAVFSYDARGRMLSAANQHISYEMVYDKCGRLLSRTDSNGRVVSYRYDALGNRRQMITPEGLKVSYEYARGSSLARIDSWAGTFGFACGSSGRRSALSFPNGMVTGFIYDSLGNLTEIITREGSKRHELITAFIYTHDRIGNRLSRTVLGGRRGIRCDFAYDPVYQLVKSMPVKVEGEEKLPDEAEIFVYDPLGNRLPGPKADWACIYNGANQLLQDREFRYQYDAHGNLTCKSVENCKVQCMSCEYDFDNRLVRVISNQAGKMTSISFKYDPFGRRIEKRIEEPGSQAGLVEIHDYVYDQDHIIIEILTASAAGSEKGQTIRYLHGQGANQPLAVEQGDDLYFYHADGTGSITSLTDKKGRLVQTCDYTSFGCPRPGGSRVRQPFAFAGREWDEKTGLYFFGARYYDPAAGRFLSRDPRGFAGGDENLYRLAENNPVNLDGLVKSR